MAPSGPTMQSFNNASERIVKYAARFVDSQYTAAAIKIYESELNRLWNVFFKMYEQISKTPPVEPVEGVAKGESAPITIEDIDKLYMDTLDTYATMSGRISEMKDQLNRSQAVVKPAAPELETSEGHGFRVSPCDIPPFRGDYASWPTFRDLFNAIYIKNPRLSKVETLYHLLQKTKGDAYDLVQRAPLTNEGFDIAWQNLTSTYENKRVLTNNQLEILYKLQPIRSENSAGLKSLQRGIDSVLDSLKLLNIDVNSWDPMIVFFASQRLPDTTLTLWEQSLTDKTTIPSWNTFSEFLTVRCQTLESIAGARSTSLFKKNIVVTASTPKKNTFHTDASKSDKMHCPACSKSCPKIRLCEKFKAMTAFQKMTFIKSNNMCLNCLGPGHIVSQCLVKTNCSVCARRHHTWLHLGSNATSPVDRNPVTSSDRDPSTSNSHTFHQRDSCQLCDQSSKCVILGTANVLIRHNGLTYTARALLDSGSKVTFITSTLRKRLRLPVSKTKVNITGIKEISTSSSQLCNFQLTSLVDQEVKIDCQALVLNNITDNLPSMSLDLKHYPQLPNLQLADKNFHKTGPIDLLIGGDLYSSVILDGVKHNVLGKLIAQNTIFGWVLTGLILIPSVRSYCSTISVQEDKLANQLQKFWEMEEFPNIKHRSPSDTYCEELFRSTTFRNDDGRYVVTLPFKPSSEYVLGESRSRVLKQYLYNEARLSKNVSLKTSYDAVLNEYITLNHMDSNIKKLEESEPKFYLPHHPVIKPESTTTSLRVVFNASFKTSGGSSLNEALYAGPVLQNDLTFLILKWRLFQYVFSSDITKMYRQILVNPSQRRFQRIFFRDDMREPVKEHELKTVTFGVNCAPFLAIRTLLQLSEDVFQTHPLASKILRSNMYVDDVLAGYHDISTALLARDQLVDALSSAGFELRKWTSNHRRILDGIPESHFLDSTFLEFEESSSTKALGVRWNAIRDEFYFDTQPISHKENITKREILSLVAKLFDPAGWLGPVVIVAKMILQQMWLEKTDWDESPSTDVLCRWEEFIKEYPTIKELKIPRWLKCSGNSYVQIHGFCDASEKAYAGTIYISVSHNGSCVSNLLMAKTRVAPVKTVSLPRLELCGALLLSSMMKTICTEFSFSNYNIFCWTDSKIVLAWLQRPPCTWTTFVANRIAKIQEKVGIECWNHVASAENPADIASRGCNASFLMHNTLWWTGPSWLKLDQDHWPNQGSYATTEEMKRVKSHVCRSSGMVDDILSRFSSYPQTLRVMSFAIRFVKACQKKNYANSLDLSTAEIKETRQLLIKLSQQQHFFKDYALLRAKELLDRKSDLLSLNPMLDTCGIMRVNGRLILSQSLSMNEKSPILLPYWSKLSRLLVQFIHDLSLHGGHQLMLRLVRQEFWIPKATNLIKMVINRCKTCVLYKQRCAAQIMAALPVERCSFSRAFTNVGLDFAGPIEVKSFIGRACRLTKAYVCVFVCFSTKAIHLEATSNLTTDCFLGAFARFVSRRGCPLNVYSDNGTTFVGASNVLKRNLIECVRQSSNLISQRHVSHGSTWHFIPPEAPHMGGLWEAGVKSFKLHFRKIASNIKLTFEEFSTVLCRIEACLNSRPLSLQSDSATELVPLTPGHFLIGTPLLAPAEPLLEESPESLTNRWLKVKALAQLLAARWKEEYLMELQRRSKWKQPRKDLAVDDIVVIRKENLPPHEWRLGRVLRVYPGKDGRTRVVDLHTQRGLITRPIVKLVPLPVESA